MPSPNLTISEGLLDHLKKLFFLGLEDVVANDTLEGINGFTSFAIPAYIISVTIVEAFLNEMFISQAGRSYFRGSESSDFWRKMEWKKLTEKLVVLPEKYFGCSLPLDRGPYKDMKFLVDLRNDLVHYKMISDAPSYIKFLQDRKVTLTEPDNLWIINVSTIEGIRWAHNTVCQTLRTIGNCEGADIHLLLLRITSKSSFDSFPDSFIYDWLIERGVQIKR